MTNILPFLVSVLDGQNATDTGVNSNNSMKKKEEIFYTPHSGVGGRGEIQINGVNLTYGEAGKLGFLKKAEEYSDPNSGNNPLYSPK